VFGFKYAGAAAERGDALDTVADTARHALENTRSMEPFGPRALLTQQNVWSEAAAHQQRLQAAGEAA
jgi:hypothetical protein